MEFPWRRTRWTVYLPDDLDAQPVRSTRKHDLSLSDNSEKLYGQAVLQETDALLGFLEQTIASNRRSKARNNLKQIELATSNLKQLGLALDSYQVAGDRDFAKSKAELKQRLSEVERTAQDESRLTNEFFAR